MSSIITLGACPGLFPHLFTVPHCGNPVELPVVSTETGTHYLRYTLDGYTHSIASEITTVGDRFMLDVTKLPENREVHIEIISPTDGRVLQFDIASDDSATPCTNPISLTTNCYWVFKVRAQIAFIGSSVRTTEIIFNPAEPWS